MNTINIISRYEFPNSDFVWEKCKNGQEWFERIYGTAQGHRVQFIKDYKSNRIDLVIDEDTSQLKPSENLKIFIKQLVQGKIR